MVRWPSSCYAAPGFIRRESTEVCMEASAQAASVIRFGVFELDARSGELRRSGVLLNLQDQPLKVLECLLERPGELVTRDALRQRLWPGDTFVDFEQGVNAAVKRLRETLADSAESPRFVETLPRRGYRFIAPVERDDRDRPGSSPPRHRINAPAWQASRLPSAVVEKPPAVARRWRRALSAVGAIALVLMTIAAWLRRASPETPVRTAASGRSHDADRLGVRADLLTGW